jgi:predicted  nucleic acid-binding Zn-ribbon protein
MSPATENLVLEHLRAIRATVDRLSDDMQEVKGRLGILEQQYASISLRLDRMDDRVLRIERRLGLVEV